MRPMLTTAAFCALLGATAFGQCPSPAPPTFESPRGPVAPDQRASGAIVAPIRSTDAPRTTPTRDGKTPTPRDARRRGARTPQARAGIVLTVTRGESSRKRLRVDWKYPKPKGEQKLDYESVLKELRRGDPRPMLILREGSDYGKGYDRRLQSILSREKTALMTRWFRCVRFTTVVMDERHPYHALFSGKYPPHAYVVSWNGATSIPISGAFSTNEVQRNMAKVLRLEYRKDPNKAIRTWLRLLSRYDELDQEQRKLKAQRASIEIASGTESAKYKKLSLKLAKLTKRRRAHERSERKLLDLGLKRKHDAKTRSTLLDQLQAPR